MINVSRVCALVSLITALAGPGTSGAQSPGPCVSATTKDAQMYRDGYADMVSRTGTSAATQRTNLSLPTLQASQVLIVSDTTTCRTASNAFDNAAGVSAAGEAPIVLQLGTQWVVVKRLTYPGPRLNILFNQNFSTAQEKIWF